MDSHYTRRHMIRLAAGAGLAAALVRPSGATTAAAAKRKFTMDLRCGSIGVKADQREAIHLAHKYGFESVEPIPGFLAALSDAQNEELLALLHAKGLVWGAAALPVNFRRDEATMDRELERLPVLAAALQRAGATRVGTWISPTSNLLTYRRNFELHVKRLRRVARILGRYGQRFGLEYVGPKTSWSAGRYPFIHTMAEMRELIDAIGEPNVGLVLDSWHWYTAGETKEDLLSLTGDDVVACDLNDAPAGIPVDQQRDTRRQLPAATGVIDLAAFLGALVTIGYDGPVRAEPFNQALNAMPNEQAVAATAAAMKKAFALVEGT